MSREVKRVAAGFYWPMEKVWSGFINPHFKPCPADGVTCFNGQTAAGAWLDAICRFLGIVGEECIRYPSREIMRQMGARAPHPYVTEFPQAPVFPGSSEILPLTEELVDLLAKFAGVERRAFAGFNSRANWDIQKKLCSVAGLDALTFGQCPVCHGDSLDPGVSEVYNAWQPTEPPAGEWWQLWETVSEGSPITPAFSTAAQLIEYLVAGGDAWDRKRGEPGWSHAAAVQLVNAGWAPGAAIVTDTAGVKVYTPRDGMPPTTMPEVQP